MARTITSSPRGTNRTVEAVTANFVVPSASDAGSYNSTAVIPANALILGVNVRANVAMASGTNVTVNIGDAEGGTAVALTAVIITADLNAVLKQDVQVAVAPLVLTAAAVASGLVSITTVGAFDAGDIDVTVFYVI